jgi:hypothetical protein
MKEYEIHAERRAGMPAEGLVVRAADAARRIAELYGLISIVVEPRERETSGENGGKEKGRHASV